MKDKIIEVLASLAIMGLAVLLWYLNLVAMAWVIDEVYPASEYPTKGRNARAWSIWGAFVLVVIEVWFFVFIIRIVKPRDPGSRI
jgi:hypothetical protein